MNREDFEILKKVVYLDSACQSLRPRQVVEKIVEYYTDYPGCGGRSMHRLSKKVDEEVLRARTIAMKFFNAQNAIFTRNATESINLVANALGLKPCDAVLTTDKEHNSNLIPWQKMKNNVFEYGNLEDLKNKLSRDTRIVAMAQTSNMDGTSMDIREAVKICHDNGSLVLVDAAQSAPHREINFKKLCADFMALSGHKMLGPSGTGLLLASDDALKKLGTFIVGGDTVSDSTYSSATFEHAPEKFEAGLQDYSGIVGFGRALEYLKKIGFNEIEKNEQVLNKQITDALAPEVEILGPVDSKMRGAIFSFNIKGMDNHNICAILDEHRICTRSGAFCCHSWFNAHRIKGAVRASLYLYNNEEDCKKFIDTVLKIKKAFA